ncbi:hypothetical protein H7X87_01685 [Acetobacteraceae bacterium]|nr:hypothetical protein [Candidatus Parcubacteria bacterium]
MSKSRVPRKFLPSLAFSIGAAVVGISTPSFAASAAVDINKQIIIDQNYAGNVAQAASYQIFKDIDLGVIDGTVKMTAGERIKNMWDMVDQAALDPGGGTDTPPTITARDVFIYKIVKVAPQAFNYPGGGTGTDPGGTGGAINDPEKILAAMLGFDEGGGKIKGTKTSPRADVQILALDADDGYAPGRIAFLT